MILGCRLFQPIQASETCRDDQPVARVLRLVVCRADRFIAAVAFYLGLSAGSRKQYAILAWVRIDRKGGKTKKECVRHGDHVRSTLPRARLFFT